MQLEITQKAKDELKSGGVDANSYLRLVVKPGGCAGMQYDMVLEDTKNDDDKIIYNVEDLRVVSDPESLKYFEGLTIDYSDDLIESGFTLFNPNAKNSCGCGSSFGC